VKKSFGWRTSAQDNEECTQLRDECTLAWLCVDRFVRAPGLTVRTLLRVRFISSSNFAGLASALQFFVRADAATAAILALALHSLVRTEAAAVAVLAVALAPPMNADAAPATFFAVALSTSMCADTAPEAFLTFAFHAAMVTDAGSAAALAPAFLHPMLANAASTTFFATRPDLHVLAYAAAAAVFALAFLSLVDAPAATATLLAPASGFSVRASFGFRIAAAVTLLFARFRMDCCQRNHTGRLVIALVVHAEDHCIVQRSTKRGPMQQCKLASGKWGVACSATAKMAEQGSGTAPCGSRHP
jgi:hypothetical protein